MNPLMPTGSANLLDLDVNSASEFTRQDSGGDFKDAFAQKTQEIARNDSKPAVKETKTAETRDENKSNRSDQSKSDDVKEHETTSRVRADRTEEVKSNDTESEDQNTSGMPKDASKDPLKDTETSEQSNPAVAEDSAPVTDVGAELSTEALLVDGAFIESKQAELGAKPPVEGPILAGISPRTELDKLGLVRPLSEGSELKQNTHTLSDSISPQVAETLRLHRQQVNAMANTGATPLTSLTLSDSVPNSPETSALTDLNKLKFNAESSTEKVVNISASDKSELQPTKLLSGVSNVEKNFLLKGEGQLSDKLAILEPLIDKSSKQNTTQTINPITQASQSILSSSGTLNSPARMQMPVNISFGQSGWGTMVAERAAMMASQNIKFAELQLDPPELGPLQVKVTVNQDQASVAFVTANAQVKDALDQTLMRLKEMLEEQGLNLADADVSEESFTDSTEEDEEMTGLASDGESEEMEDEDGNSVIKTEAQYGIDHYA